MAIYGARHRRRSTAPPHVLLSFHERISEERIFQLLGRKAGRRPALDAITPMGDCCENNGWIRPVAGVYLQNFTRLKRYHKILIVRMRTWGYTGAPR